MFGNKYTDDEYKQFEAYEAYERHKQEQMAKGIGRFLYWYLTGSLIWFFSAIIITFILNIIFKTDALGVPIGMILAIFIFKIPYVKENRWKATIITTFLFFVILAKTS